MDGLTMRHRRCFSSASEETRALHLPDLRIKFGVGWIFRIAHNRLMQRAAEQISEVLNGRLQPSFVASDWKM
jgi:hypothetical protein